LLHPGHENHLVAAFAHADVHAAGAAGRARPGHAVAGRQPMCRMKKFRPTSVVTAIALSVCVGAVGLGISSTREMPGRVSAGEHELRMLVQGAGSPTVILETIGPANLENWNHV